MTTFPCTASFRSREETTCTESRYIPYIHSCIYSFWTFRPWTPHHARAYPSEKRTFLSLHTHTHTRDSSCELVTSKADALAFAHKADLSLLSRPNGIAKRATSIVQLREHGLLTELPKHQLPTALNLAVAASPSPSSTPQLHTTIYSDAHDTTSRL